MKKEKLIDKKVEKDKCKKCPFCGEEERSTFNIHRWKVEGKDGGKYTKYNSISCCCNCHAKIHAKEIIILGKFFSTAGEVLIYLDEDGKENIIKL